MAPSSEKGSATSFNFVDSEDEEEFEDLEEPVHEVSIQFGAVLLSADRDSCRVALASIVLDPEGRIMDELIRTANAQNWSSTACYFEALRDALDKVQELGVANVRAYCDFIAVKKLLTGVWKPRSKKLRELEQQLRCRISNLSSFSVHLRKTGPMCRSLQNLVSSCFSGSSSSSNCSCAICFEDKAGSEMFALKACTHSFCAACVAQHAEVQLKAGQVFIPCPEIGCGKFLDMEDCQRLLSQESLQHLHQRLREADIPQASRVYCPDRNCSALMDKRDPSFGDKSVCAQCVRCSKLFCVDCRVPWHTSLSCDEYQSLPPNKRDAGDAKLHYLAMENSWRRCKICRSMIERGEGCFHMTCRCGYEFCYLCGAEWKDKKQTCSCQLFDDEYSDDDYGGLLDTDDDLEPSEFFGVDDDDDDAHEEFIDYYDDESFIDFEVMSEYHSSVTFTTFTASTSSSSSSSSAGVIFNNVNNHNNTHFFKYKTKLCRYWQSGHCRDGDECNFAHGPADLRPRHTGLLFEDGWIIS